MRVQDFFSDQMKLPISKGSVINFNRDAFNRLEYFEGWAKKQLLISTLNHADETGINVNAKRLWIHNLSNNKITLYHADEKRGKENMDRMGILQNYKGIVCHDHWFSYYRYGFTHALCNAHHLREPRRAWEQDGQIWAQSMHTLLEKMNEAVKKSKNGKLSGKEIAVYQKRYRGILSAGKKECPSVGKERGKRGRQKQSKARNLLNRLEEFEEDTLRFMKEAIVPFTNNQGENDLRMTKVQQKISGCFRSMDGAKIFCCVRSYLMTCRKNDVGPIEALRLLFQGKLPDFVQ